MYLLLKSFLKYFATDRADKQDTAKSTGPHLKLLDELSLHRRAVDESVVGSLNGHAKLYIIMHFGGGVNHYF
jgi:hypothetical protein